ncbi:MAG: dethiobiotin synthase [Desulfobulbaceae bacterium]|nr:dethiobiotin synthase [Desulfobulbaceae bacterium]
MAEGAKTIFVAGTGTGVGKTFVCGLLLRFARQRCNAGYQKWVSTGGEMPEDWRFCRETAGLSLDMAVLGREVPFRFIYPASPHLAAEREGREVDPQVIVDRYHEMAAAHELLIVEGAGGLLVPLRRDLLLVDLLARLAPPTLLVAKSGLGTINHTLLSLEALRSRNIPVLGVVFSDGSEDAGDEELVNDNMRVVAEVGQCRVFGRLPRCRDLAEAAAAFAPIGEALIAAL